MLYAVQMTEHAQGSRAETYLVGVFDTKYQASVALHQTFLKQCDVYCVDENLCDETQCDTDSSYYNVDKDFSIDYKQNGEVAGEVFGSITEIELNKTMISLEID